MRHFEKKILFILLAVFVYGSCCFSAIAVDNIDEKKELNNGIKKQKQVNNASNNNSNQQEAQNIEYRPEEIDKLFIPFNQDDKINSIDDIKYAEHPWLIENVAKLNILKKHYVIQNDDELRKRYEMEILSKEEERARLNRVENSMLLMSLVYFNDKYWKCSIDGKKVDNLTKNEAHKKASIVKVNKRSILFVLNVTDKDNVALVSKIIAEKKQNYGQYQIIKSGTKKIVMFRLFIGQKIDFDTMEISSISGVA